MSVGGQRSSGGVLTKRGGVCAGVGSSVEATPTPTHLFVPLYISGKNLSVYSYGFQEQEDGLIRPQAAASVVGRDAS